MHRDKGYNAPKMTKNRPKKVKTLPKIFDDQILFLSKKVGIYQENRPKMTKNRLRKKEKIYIDF